LNLATPWISASNGTPDYFNQCSGGVGIPNNNFGSQLARTGQGYAGLILTLTVSTFYEYIEVELTSPLIANTCYYFEMYVSIADKSKFTTDDIGVYFSVPLFHAADLNPLSWSGIVPYVINTPGNYFSDNTWTMVSGYFTANGNEKYMVIGNFLDAPGTSLLPLPGFKSSSSPYCYAFIDDVSLNEVPCIVLPVELLNFSAQKLNNSVELNWTTASEINNDYFLIDKSKDGNIFSQIGLADGAGNSTVTSDYKFIDENPFDGISYYRLKQVDFNGKHSFSEIVAVNFSSLKNEIRIESNQSSAVTTFYFPDELLGKTNIAIFNSQGEIVLNEFYRDRMNTYSLNYESLSKGIYFISIENTNRYYNARFVVL
jgi:hypothetical protein